MTKLFFRLSIFSMMLSTLFMTSCEEDISIPGPGTGADAPTVRLLSGSDLISSDADLNANDAFKVQLSANQGDALLRSLQIFENGVKLPTSRLEINGSPAAANPILIVVDADKTSFTYDITISGLPAGVNNYEFEVTDEDGEASSTSVNVTGISEPLAIALQQPGDIEGAEPGSLVAIPISVKQGGSPLSTIGVTSGGVSLAPGDLAFLEANSANTFMTNPMTLSAEQQGGFEGNIYIRAGSGDGTYIITVTDEAGESVTANVVINATTALSGEFTAVVLNNNSGPNKGGLDLYNGVAVSTASEFDRAQIVDQGIDTDLAVSVNWLQQLAPVNGARLRTPGSNQPEGFKYENINSQEAIIAAFESAGDDVAKTGKLEVGDILLVNSGDDYFILQIADINVTTDNNRDFYEINIKQAIQ